MAQDLWDVRSFASRTRVSVICSQLASTWTIGRRLLGIAVDGGPTVLWPMTKGSPSWEGRPRKEDREERHQLHHCRPSSFAVLAVVYVVRKLSSLATKRDVSTRANVMDTSPKTAYYYKIVSISWWLELYLGTHGNNVMQRHISCVEPNNILIVKFRSNRRENHFLEVDRIFIIETSGRIISKRKITSCSLQSVGEVCITASRCQPQWCFTFLCQGEE